VTTKTITVTDAAWVAVTATTDTRRISVQEDPSVANWPTTDYLVAKPLSSSVQIRKLAGAKYVFERGEYMHRAGSVAGYVKTVSGTTTFAQDESGI